MIYHTILSQDLKRIINDPDIFLLDVRTPEEYEIVNLGGKLIPDYELQNILHELPLDKTIVVICHHGVRSGRVVNFLIEKGYNKVKNLVGGIDRYAQEADTSLRRY